MYKYMKNKRSRQASCGLCNMSDNTYQQQNINELNQKQMQKIIDTPDQKNNDFEINTKYDNDLEVYTIKTNEYKEKVAQQQKVTQQQPVTQYYTESQNKEYTESQEKEYIQKEVVKKQPSKFEKTADKVFNSKAAKGIGKTADNMLNSKAAKEIGKIAKGIVKVLAPLARDQPRLRKGFLSMY